MKSAEEVADSLRYKGNHLGNCPAGCKDIKLIAQALTQYSEEIKADRDRWADSACRLENAQEKIKEQSRSAALEEAAKEADDEERMHHKYVVDYEQGQRDEADLIAQRIRALKK